VIDKKIMLNTPCTQYGVLWRLKLVPGDAVQEEYTEYSGVWYDDVAPALKELERARTNPRCADARLSRRKITYTELTGNAVEWAKENQKEWRNYLLTTSRAAALVRANLPEYCAANHVEYAEGAT